MKTLLEKLYPICRSITGNGVRESLGIIKKYFSNADFNIVEVPTGTKVYDWKVPKEWNIRTAWIKDSNGNKLVDFDLNNLHLVSYSIPIDKKMGWEELKKHIHTIPDKPDWIPYRTSYYNEDWGFCISHNDLEDLEVFNGVTNNAEYHVYIDSSLTQGNLTYGELYLPGQSDEEILLSTYICHPSMANDNLSGPVLLTELAKNLALEERHYSYRFLFIPETIGAITWLSKNEHKLNKIVGGLVATCIGDDGVIQYKRSRQTTMIDNVVEKVLKDTSAVEEYHINDFEPLGSDERQYCSPGINLPIGCLTRTPYGKFEEYHTSADNLDFVSESSLEASYNILKEIIYYLEYNRTYTNVNPKCEPNFGKRGLYDLIGAGDRSESIPLYKWILNYSDGNHSLIDISNKCDVNFNTILEAAKDLEMKDLIK